jgi:cytochrome c556
MIRPVLASVAIVVGATVAFAQADPIAQRKSIMKANGAATRTGTQMVRGEIPFELGKAQEILKVYAASAKSYHEYFPESSKTGGDTTASPKIWENQADFRARFDQWGRDIEQAAQATKDFETFKASFGNLTKACGACHQTYRISRS